MKEEKSELSQILSRIGAIKFGTFKLTSGRVSPYYFDLRIIPSFPDAFMKICELLTKFLEKDLAVDNFERIAGIPIAGIPFASVIALNLKKPLVYIRSKVKPHGRERRIEGLIMPGDRVLLVDELVTTGLSLRKAAKKIRSEGGLVSDALVLLDREEEGKERLLKEHIKLHCLLTASEVATKLFELGTIEEDQLETILRQTKKKRRA